MLSVLRVHLPSDIPIVGCELSPYVLLRRPDQSVFTDDVPETSPIEGHFLRYKWLVSYWFFVVKSCCFMVIQCVSLPIEYGRSEVLKFVL